MITELTIRGFRRFRECILEFAPLTVLTGTNGSGKTSVIHALLLAREAQNGPTVALNGPYGLELGSAADVLNVHTTSSQIQVSLRYADNQVVAVDFDASIPEHLYLPVNHRDPPHGALTQPAPAFTYLCAERYGPREVLKASAVPVDELGVGTHGEFSAQVLAHRGLQTKVSRKRWHASSRETDAFLKYQVEAWMSAIVRPITIETVWCPNTAMTAMRFRTPDNEKVRAPNMGFGVSYALPIVLACLIAPEDGLLIVENPEAHLHPAGQSQIGYFLAHIAAAGVQVVLETHSDHVLNGIRRAVGEAKLLGADQAVVHLFDTDGDNQPTATTLRLTPTGSISEWPRRFFDQYQVDIAALARVRRPPGT